MKIALNISNTGNWGQQVTVASNQQLPVNRLTTTKTDGQLVWFDLFKGLIISLSSCSFRYFGVEQKSYLIDNEYYKLNFVFSGVHFQKSNDKKDYSLEAVMGLLNLSENQKKAPFHSPALYHTGNGSCENKLKNTKVPSQANVNRITETPSARYFTSGEYFFQNDTGRKSFYNVANYTSTYKPSNAQTNFDVDYFRIFSTNLNSTAVRPQPKSVSVTEHTLGKIFNSLIPNALVAVVKIYTLNIRNSVMPTLPLTTKKSIPARVNKGVAMSHNAETKKNTAGPFLTKATPYIFFDALQVNPTLALYNPFSNRCINDTHLKLLIENEK